LNVRTKFEYSSFRNNEATIITVKTPCRTDDGSSKAMGKKPGRQIPGPPSWGLWQWSSSSLHVKTNTMLKIRAPSLVGILLYRCGKSKTDHRKTV